MILKLFLFIFVCYTIYYFISNKIKIKFKTFFKRGFQVKKGIYGIYTYCGFQGDGKTYSCVEYVMDNYSNIQLFSNVKINNINYTFYRGFKGLLQLRDAIDMANYFERDFIIFEGNKIPFERDKQIVFIYDEIFSELQRGSKIDNNVLDFITQMRKRGFILLTTSQIWSDIPLTWRRLTRYQIDCKMKNLLITNILVKTFHDAEQMKWSNDDQEFVAPIISTTITHVRKFIANSYDTFQLIHNKYSTFSSDEDSKKTSSEKKEFPHGGDRGLIDSDIWDNENIEALYEKETK